MFKKLLLPLAMLCVISCQKTLEFPPNPNPTATESGIDVTTIPLPGSVIFTLVNALTGEDIRVIKHGDTINLANLPTRKLNIRAEPITNSRLGTVVICLRFEMEVKTNFDYAAPYLTMTDEITDALTWTLKPTKYRLACRAADAYSLISFEVIDRPVIAESTPQPPAVCIGKVSFDPTKETQMYGDSYTESPGTWPETVTKAIGDATGFPTINRGISGQISTQIKDRFLADGKFDRNTIIWAGANNYMNFPVVKADIATMVAQLGHKRFIVIGILGGDRENEFRGTKRHTQILQLNKDLAAIYGDNFLEVRTPLIAAYDPAVPADVINYSNDVTPSSMRVDYLHLNRLGCKFIAGLIKEKLCQVK